MHPARLLLVSLTIGLRCHADAPRDAGAIGAAEWPENWRLRVSFSSLAGGALRWPDGFLLPLKGAVHDIALEHPQNSPPVLRVWSDGKPVRGPEEVSALAPQSGGEFSDAKIDLCGDFTALVRFSTAGNGTLFSKCAPGSGKWSPDAKALFVRGGRLVYDIGWLGALSGGPTVSDGMPHAVILTVRGGTARLWLDGNPVAAEKDFTRPDAAGHVLKTGRAAPDFAGRFEGRLAEVRIWQRALEDAEIGAILRNGPQGANTPDFAWQPAARARPAIEPAAGVITTETWIQPLERADHGEIVRGWNDRTLAEGKSIYSQLCVVCHGTREQPGSLPTALRFTEGAFKNGADPHAQFLTLTKGFGQMVPQPQYTTQQKYAVIHYIREAFLRPHNPSQLTELTAAYLDRLPKGLTRAEAEQEDRSPPPYAQMELGPALFWTLEVDAGNIAQKAIAVRLDEGPGGVTKGRAWMVYDHDTMRVAAATTGDFVDWRGIAFDGSHGTHTSLTGTRVFVNPPGPGWANPDTGAWDDPRPRGRDGQPYGPLPRRWAHYRGLYRNGQTVVSYTVGEADVLDSPGWLDYGATPVFVRTINVCRSLKPLLLRVAPVAVNVALRGHGALKAQDGFWIAEFPGNAKSRLGISRADQATLEALTASCALPLDLASLTHGGPSRWARKIPTEVVAGAGAGPFAADTLTLPEENPWKAWLRPGGFDFVPDGTSAVVAMWNGDVWKVDGLIEPAPGPLRWQRMAAGLFQPVGVKFRGDDVFIGCRDQIACLKDLNGDGETDFIESFNNDHQVTEHFHEFAMGLQTDAAGNFYYAKSARHALPAVVPHHGTLLRVSADGSRTDILATGFRAANGVCLNDDGSFFVTDQEGHWTPKNRINFVKPGGFYGNLFGFTDITDPSDSAMQPPMVWITNDKDRSPAELLRVPKHAWGPLGGTLLNLSYGTGKIFAVPNEEVDGVWQGAVCELPLPAFPSGTMRGRFGPDGALYVCGMFAWAGNATAPGGFHRIRWTGRPAHVPVAVRARRDSLEIDLSDPIDPASVSPDGCRIKIWSLKRSADYGSPHIGEKSLAISAAAAVKDGKSITLTIQGLAPVNCYELILRVRDSAGNSIERNLHGTIHRLR
jgi:Concanavalin A-like lectin/glucanases superfamily/Cytochrome C oxidase, cbb3-type, subunit III